MVSAYWILCLVEIVTWVVPVTIMILVVIVAQFYSLDYEKMPALTEAEIKEERKAETREMLEEYLPAQTMHRS